MLNFIIGPCLHGKSCMSQLPVSQFSSTSGFTGTMEKVYRALIGLRVEPHNLPV